VVQHTLKESRIIVAVNDLAADYAVLADRGNEGEGELLLFGGVFTSGKFESFVAKGAELGAESLLVEAYQRLLGLIFYKS
jgi:hypothetical protein